MFVFYIAEFAFGNSAGPFSTFCLDHEWLPQDFAIRCNESIWLVPGTVQS